MVNLRHSCCKIPMVWRTDVERRTDRATPTFSVPKWGIYCATTCPPTQSGKSRGNIEASVKPVIPRGGTWKAEPDCWDAILDKICSYPPDWVCFPEWEWEDMCLAVLRSKKVTGITRWGCCCLQWLRITAIPFLHLRGHSTLSVTTPSSVTTSQMGILLWKGLSCPSKTHPLHQ
jgi:hypothetical protein